ncbi:hypothetical protein CDAR_117751 [Caerostris darwini]|uniref:Uncharacterized protein n=1 Tax=Caerostris darwini TaxID=1538125 RepID=A0AAV4PW52_9ARAC|nr:hypothetical protein CDAR_117751 [Caerostris darwini]
MKTSTSRSPLSPENVSVIYGYRLDHIGKRNLGVQIWQFIQDVKEVHPGCSKSGLEMIQIDKVFPEDVDDDDSEVTEWSYLEEDGMKDDVYDLDWEEIPATASKTVLNGSELDLDIGHVLRNHHLSYKSPKPPEAYREIFQDEQLVESSWLLRAAGYSQHGTPQRQQKTATNPGCYQFPGITKPPCRLCRDNWTIISVHQAGDSCSCSCASIQEMPASTTQ